MSGQCEYITPKYRASTGEVWMLTVSGLGVEGDRLARWLPGVSSIL